MKNATYRSLGVQIAVAVPDTVEEFDKNAKREGACLNEGNNNVVYRGMLGTIRDLAIHGQEEEKDESGKITQPAFKGWEEISGKDRAVKKEKKGDKEIEVYAESEQAYVDRVVGVWETDQAPDAWVKHMNAAAKLVPFDASATERKPAGPKKLAEKYKTLALSFLTGKKDLAKLQKAFAKDLNGQQFTAPVATPKDDPKNVEALGWMCKAWEAAQDQFKGM